MPERDICAPAPKADRATPVASSEPNQPPSRVDATHADTPRKAQELRFTLCAILP
jgi:hypothetical protein